MRSISGSDITYSSAAEVTGPATQTRVVEAAAPDIMQSRVASVLAELAASPVDWLLTHIDLAGGGDGHTFVCTMEFAATATQPPLAVPPVGLDIEANELSILFYMAAQSEALTAARNSIRPAIAALFSPPLSSARVDVRQTLEAGASKGTRFMGALVLQLTPLT